MKRGLFVTGTDTGVGKTFASALICAALQHSGANAGYFKPVQTGEEDDAAEVARLAPLDAGGLPRPVYRFPLPAAPWRAADAAGETIHLETIAARWKALGDRKWVIEGAGGVMVPLTRHATFLELLKLTGLPVALVASTRLGTINHILLTLGALESAGVPVQGILLNGEPDPGLKVTLAAFSEAPVLAEIPPLGTPDRVRFANAALDLFPPRVLARLFGAVTGAV